MICFLEGTVNIYLFQGLFIFTASFIFSMSKMHSFLCYTVLDCLVQPRPNLSFLSFLVTPSWSCWLFFCLAVFSFFFSSTRKSRNFAVLDFFQSLLLCIQLMLSHRITMLWYPTEFNLFWPWWKNSLLVAVPVKLKLMNYENNKVLMSLGLESKNNLPFNFVPHKI